MFHDDICPCNIGGVFALTLVKPFLLQLCLPTFAMLAKWYFHAVLRLLHKYVIAVQVLVILQVQSMVNAMRGSHNRVEAFVCLYARMVDKENLWLVLYALKVSFSKHLGKASLFLPLTPVWRMSTHAPIVLLLFLLSLLNSACCSACMCCIQVNMRHLLH